jgi:hypothetical protein
MLFSLGGPFIWNFSRAFDGKFFASSRRANIAGTLSGHCSLTVALTVVFLARFSRREEV